MNSLLMTESFKSCEERQKWQRILGEKALLLGEGDFQLSSSLAKAGVTGLTATELRSEEEVCATYPQAAENIAAVRRSGNQVLFGVNALIVTIPEGCTGVFWAHPYPYKGFMNDIYRSLVRRCTRRGCDFHVVEKGAEFRPRFGEEMLAGADDLELVEKHVMPGSSIPTWEPVRTKGPVLELIPADATIVIFKLECEHRPLPRIPGCGGHLSPISESSPTPPQEVECLQLEALRERAATWSAREPGNFQLPTPGRSTTWTSVLPKLARVANKAEAGIKLPAPERSSSWTAKVVSNQPAPAATELRLPVLGRSTTWTVAHTKPSDNGKIKLQTPERSTTWTAKLLSNLAQAAASGKLQDLRLPEPRRASTWSQGRTTCAGSDYLLARSESSLSSASIPVC